MLRNKDNSNTDRASDQERAIYRQKNHYCVICKSNGVLLAKAVVEVR